MMFSCTMVLLPFFQNYLLHLLFKFITMDLFYFLLIPVHDLIFQSSPSHFAFTIFLPLSTIPFLIFIPKVSFQAVNLLNFRRVVIDVLFQVTHYLFILSLGCLSDTHSIFSKVIYLIHHDHPFF